MKTFGVRAAESVDGLVGIPYDEQALMSFGPGSYQLILNIVNVLVLVYEQIGKRKQSPVSYTHLDVYKRQAIGNVRFG